MTAFNGFDTHGLTHGQWLNTDKVDTIYDLIGGCVVAGTLLKHNYFI